MFGGGGGFGKGKGGFGAGAGAGAGAGFGGQDNSSTQQVGFGVGGVSSSSSAEGTATKTTFGVASTFGGVHSSSSSAFSAGGFGALGSKGTTTFGSGQQSNDHQSASVTSPAPLTFGGLNASSSSAASGGGFGAFGSQGVTAFGSGQQSTDQAGSAAFGGAATFGGGETNESTISAFGVKAGGFGGFRQSRGATDGAATGGFGAQTSGFGSQATGTTFGTTHATGSNFGSTTDEGGVGYQAAGTTFGNTQAASGTGFGAQTGGSTFGGQATGIGFGAKAAGSGFGAPTTSSGFGAQAPGGFGAQLAGGFGSQASTGLPATGSGFGSQAGTTFGSQTSGGFGSKVGEGATRDGIGTKAVGFGALAPRGPGTGQADVAPALSSSSSFAPQAAAGFGASGAGFGSKGSDAKESRSSFGSSSAFGSKGASASVLASSTLDVGPALGDASGIKLGAFGAGGEYLCVLLCIGECFLILCNFLAGINAQAHTYDRPPRTIASGGLGGREREGILSSRSMRPASASKSRSRIAGMDESEVAAMREAVGRAPKPSFLGASHPPELSLGGGGDGYRSHLRGETALPEPTFLGSRAVRKFRTNSEAVEPDKDGDDSMAASTGGVTDGVQDSWSRQDLGDAVALVGRNELMCSAKEVAERIRTDDIRMLEREHEHLLKPDGTPWRYADMCVKKFKRVTPGTRKDDPAEVRTPAALQRTMSYLEDYVMPKATSYRWGGTNNDPRIEEAVARMKWTAESAEDEVEYDVYKYIWDRTREMRGDYSMQGFQLTVGRLDSVSDLSVFERIARWHIAMDHRMHGNAAYDRGNNAAQNLEQLKATLGSLLELYKVARLKVANGGSAAQFLSPYEAELCSYHLILNLDHEGGGMALGLVQGWQKEAPEVYHSPWVQRGLEVMAARRSGNYARFFRLLRTSPYLFRCCMFMYVGVERSWALLCMDSFRTYPLSDLVNLLAFESRDEAVLFAEDHGLEVDQFEDEVHWFGSNHEGQKVPLFASPSKLPSTWKMVETVEAASEPFTLKDILNGRAILPELADEFVPLQIEGAAANQAASPAQPLPPTPRTRQSREDEKRAQALDLLIAAHAKDQAEAKQVAAAAEKQRASEEQERVRAQEAAAREERVKALEAARAERVEAEEAAREAAAAAKAERVREAQREERERIQQRERERIAKLREEEEIRAKKAQAEEEQRVAAVARAKEEAEEERRRKDAEIERERQRRAAEAEAKRAADAAAAAAAEAERKRREEELERQERARIALEIEAAAAHEREMEGKAALHCETKRVRGALTNWLASAAAAARMRMEIARRHKRTRDMIASVDGCLHLEPPGKRLVDDRSEADMGVSAPILLSFKAPALPPGPPPQLRLSRIIGRPLTEAQLNWYKMFCGESSSKERLPDILWKVIVVCPAGIKSEALHWVLGALVGEKTAKLAAVKTRMPGYDGVLLVTDQKTGAHLRVCVQLALDLYGVQTRASSSSAAIYVSDAEDGLGHLLTPLLKCLPGEAPVLLMTCRKGDGPGGLPTNSLLSARPWKESSIHDASGFVKGMEFLAVKAPPTPWVFRRPLSDYVEERLLRCLWGPLTEPGLASLVERINSEIEALRQELLQGGRDVHDWPPIEFSVDGWVDRSVLKEAPGLAGELLFVPGSLPLDWNSLERRKSWAAAVESLSLTTGASAAASASAVQFFQGMGASIRTKALLRECPGVSAGDPGSALHSTWLKRVLASHLEDRLQSLGGDVYIMAQEAAQLFTAEEAEEQQLAEASNRALQLWQHSHAGGRPQVQDTSLVKGETRAPSPRTVQMLALNRELDEAYRSKQLIESSALSREVRAALVSTQELTAQIACHDLRGTPPSVTATGHTRGSDPQRLPSREPAASAQSLMKALSQHRDESAAVESMLRNAL
jgi:hypothetical protein